MREWWVYLCRGERGRCVGHLGQELDHREGADSEQWRVQVFQSQGGGQGEERQRAERQGAPIEDFDIWSERGSERLQRHVDRN
jgi:hypothetical protein